MVGEAPRLGKACRMHENEEAELLDPGENLAKSLGREILAGDVRRDLDAPKAQRLVDPVEFGDREIRGLKRHRAERHKSVAMTAGNIGEIIIDHPCSSDPEVG